jgi:hypothetical protein
VERQDTMHLAIISGIDMIKNLNAIRELDQGDLHIDLETVSLKAVFQRLYRDFLLIADMKSIELAVGNVLDNEYLISADAYYV